MPSALSLAERLDDLVAQWLRQIGQHGAGFGLDERIDRHSGQQLETVQAGDLLGRRGDVDEVVGRAALHVLDDVARDPHHVAFDLGGRPLVEGSEAEHRRLADLQLVDALGRQLHLDDEVVRFRNDQHRGLASGEHSADRVHVQLMHDAALRGTNIDAHELVLGGDLALDQLGHLALDLAQLLRDLASQLLIDLDDLELGLGDLGASLRDRGSELAMLSLDPHRFAFELGQTRDRDEPLRPQKSHTFQLAADQLDLALLGVGLLGEALDFLPELRDPLPELRLLAGTGGFAQLEQFLLALHDAADVGMVRTRDQLLRKAELAVIIAFGFQAGLARHQLVDAFDDDGEVRTRDRRVEAHDHVAGVHPHPVPYTQLADNAAGRMLDLLDVRIDDEVARR